MAVLPLDIRSATTLASAWMLDLLRAKFHISFWRHGRSVCYKNKAHQCLPGHSVWSFFLFVCLFCWCTVSSYFLLLRMSLFGWRALKPSRQQAAVTSLYTGMALSCVLRPQRAWISCSLITCFKNIKETSENQFLVYHFFSMIIFMQMNAIHLDFLLPLKAFKAKACIWGRSLQQFSWVSNY